MRQLRAIDYFNINVYWFGLAFMWNALHPIILPAILLSFVPEELKNTYLGTLTFVGLILAMIVQPISGTISDYSTIRWGRRRPWILLGTLGDFVFLAVMALAGSYIMLFLGYILLQICSNIAHGPAQGFIPDLVPEQKRGIASGVKNLFDMGGLIIASLVAGRLMGGGNATLAFLVIGGLMLIVLVLTLIGVREEPPICVEGRSLGASIIQAMRDTFRVNVHGYRDYVWLVVSRFMILLGIYAVQGFAQYYIRDVLKMANAAQVTGDLLFSIGIALVLLVYPAGWLSDKVGRKPLNIFAGLLAALGVFLLLFVRGYTDLLTCGGIVGAAVGIFVSVNWALATDLVPAAEAGKYLGLSNLATAGSGAIARLGGPLIDFVNAQTPGTYSGYSVLFILATLSLLIGTALLFRVREPRRALEAT
jgi:MFS family permease